MAWNLIKVCLLHSTRNMSISLLRAITFEKRKGGINKNFGVGSLINSEFGGRSLTNGVQQLNGIQNRDPNIQNLRGWSKFLSLHPTSNFQWNIPQLEFMNSLCSRILMSCKLQLKYGIRGFLCSASFCLFTIDIYAVLSYMGMNESNLQVI